MNEGMIKNLVTRIKGGNTNSVAITKPSTYKPPVPSSHVKAAQAKVDAQYKADVKAGTPAARTARMKARIAAMKEEALQIDELKKSTLSSYYNKRYDQYGEKETDILDKGLSPSKENKALSNLEREHAKSKQGIGMERAVSRMNAHTDGAKGLPKNRKNTPAVNAYHKKGEMYGKALKAFEEVEQIDETGPQKKATRLHNKLRDAVRGARYKQTGMPVFEPEAQHKTPQAYNKAIGRALRGMGESVEQVAEGDVIDFSKAKRELAIKKAKQELKKSKQEPTSRDAFLPNNKTKKEDLTPAHKATITAHMIKKYGGSKEDVSFSYEDGLHTVTHESNDTGLGHTHAITIKDGKHSVAKHPHFTSDYYGVMDESVEQVDETNARHSFTAAQQVLTPRKKDVLNASSNMPRAKAAAKKYARRVAKISGTYKPKEVIAHLKSMGEETQYIEERLKSSDPTSKWVSDFVHSDNPRFAGKSKKERINMALGAYYASKKKVNENIIANLINAVKIAHKTPGGMVKKFNAFDKHMTKKHPWIKDLQKVAAQTGYNRPNRRNRNNRNRP